MITKEQIEHRLASLRQQEAEHLGRLNAINGAIQDCVFWLKVLDEQDDVPVIADALEPVHAVNGGAQ